MGVGIVAGLTIKGFDSTRKMFDQLGKYTEVVGREAVGAGADILLDEIKTKLSVSLYGSDYSTGDLINSLKPTSPRVDPKTGNIDVLIAFWGYDRKGVPNSLKARIRESGSSKQTKKPFFRPSVNRTRKKIKQKMEQIVYLNLDKIKRG